MVMAAERPEVYYVDRIPLTHILAALAGLGCSDRLAIINSEHMLLSPGVWEVQDQGSSNTTGMFLVIAVIV